MGGYDFETIKQHIANSIIMIIDKYNISPDEIKNVIFDNLNNVIQIYKKFDSIKNIEKNISKENYDLFNLYKEYILKTLDSKRIVNYLYEDKEEKNIEQIWFMNLIIHIH